MYTAKDVMSENVVSIYAHRTVKSAIGILLDLRISGAPVVDAEENLVGIITEFQLLELIYEPALAASPVSQFMTKDVITVGENTMLSDVASILIARRIRRVPVVRDGRVVGMVARRDLLRHVLEAGDQIAEFIHGVTAAVE